VRCGQKLGSNEHARCARKTCTNAPRAATPRADRSLPYRYISRSIAGCQRFLIFTQRFQRLA
jgi:hypothetical protein